jgi:hypothetical protein
MYIIIVSVVLFCRRMFLGVLAALRGRVYSGALALHYNVFLDRLAPLDYVPTRVLI